jgi:hypothetical protein
VNLTENGILVCLLLSVHNLFRLVFVSEKEQSSYTQNVDEERRGTEMCLKERRKERKREDNKRNEKRWKERLDHLHRLNIYRDYYIMRASENM